MRRTGAVFKVVVGVGIGAGSHGSWGGGEKAGFFHVLVSSGQECGWDVLTWICFSQQLLATIKKTEFLKAYLNARFSLSKGDAPHAMKF